MLMIALDVKTTASRRLKLGTIQVETTPDHLSCTVVFEFFNTSDVSFSAANSSSLVLRHLWSLLHLLFIHVLFFLLQLLLFLFLGLLLLFNLFGKLNISITITVTKGVEKMVFNMCYMFVFP